MKMIGLPVFLMVGLLAAACLPVTSKAPVGTSKGLSADAKLVGTWKLKLRSADSKSANWIHFLPAKDGSLTMLLAATGTENGKTEGDWMQFRGRSARLGENLYLNVTAVSSNGEPDKSRIARDSIILLYRYTGANTVTFYDGDEKKVAAVIAARKIAGTVEAGKDGDIILTAPAEALDKFFQSKEAASLFTTPYAVLTKAN